MILDSKFQIPSSIILVLLFMSFSVFASLAQAAEITVDSGSQEIRTGNQFEVGVFINTEGESINAIEGKIVFPEELLELKGIRSGNSIINFWIESPSVLRKTDAEIVFSGITPGGYAGKRGLVFSVIFQAQVEGEGFIEIRGVKALLNDGEGSEADVAISNLDFLISKQIPESIRQSADQILIDTDPPEPFLPIIAKDPTIFDGKYFLVFVAQDKGSGLLRYEVAEQRAKLTRSQTLNYAKMKWGVAESPYVLKDQNLRSYIYVKAIDKAGNERVITLPPTESRALYKNYLILATLIIGAVFAYIIWKFLWRKLIRKSQRI